MAAEVGIPSFIKNELLVDEAGNIYRYACPLIVNDDACIVIRVTAQAEEAWHSLADGTCYARVLRASLRRPSRRAKALIDVVINLG